VHAANEPAERQVVRDALDRVVCRVRVRLVVHREDRARDRLHEERRQRRRAERVAPADVAGHLAEEEVFGGADEPRPLLGPVQRVEQRLLELLAAARLGADGDGHQSVTAVGRSGTGSARGRRRGCRGSRCRT
jgi:hypothetical protein